MMGTAYIVKARRTAGGRKGGRLRDWHPADLAAEVLNDLVGEHDPALFEDVETEKALEILIVEATGSLPSGIYYYHGQGAF